MMNTFNSLEGNLQMHVHECGEVCGMYSGNTYSHGNSNGHYNKEIYKKIIGEVDALGNVKYRFKSDESRTVKVPVKYAKNASKLVNFALESKEFSELKARILSNKELANLYIPEEIHGIIGKGNKIGSKKSRKLIDRIYFETCVGMCTDELSRMDGWALKNRIHRKDERNLSIKQIEFFKNILESL